MRRVAFHVARGEDQQASDARPHPGKRKTATTNATASNPSPLSGLLLNAVHSHGWVL